MATNTSALKTFAQDTRSKLVALVTAKMNFLLNEDTAQTRAYTAQIGSLRNQISERGKESVIEEVAYTWFNRIMALRFMDANGYNSPMVVSPAGGMSRPEILQEAMGGIIDEDLNITVADLQNLTENERYRKLLLAVCWLNYRPMPFLFEPITDYTELLLPEDLLSESSFVSDIRKGMTDDDCKNVEIVGWLYQFYITEKKVKAEKKKSQRGGLNSEEQASATQLFTPHWIVRYMVENTLGRIWMTLKPDSEVINEMPYYITPVEGQKDVIPEDIKTVADIKFLDPCMGSGHILVYAFDLFAKMYEEEGYSTKEIPALILKNNLYGMDIDKRCYQLTCFALTMKASEYYSRYLRHTVIPNVIALQNVDRPTLESAGSWPKDSLMWKFENVDTIGSLLKITPEECNAIKVDSGVFGQNQKLLKEQAEYLSRSYHCIVTNPPYLGKGMGDELKNYLLKEYPNSKADTMATFMERSLDGIPKHGKVGMINQDSWMFTVSYKELRQDLLSSYVHIDSLIHLGAHAFAEIGGEKVKTATFVLSKTNPSLKGCYINVYNCKNHKLKETQTLEAIQNHNCGWYFEVSQDSFHYIEGEPISFWGSDKIYNIYRTCEPIEKICIPRQGLATGNNDQFLRQWYEVSSDEIKLNCNSIQNALKSGKKWFPYNKGGGDKARRWYGNQSLLIAFDENNYNLLLNMGNHLPSRHLYFKPSISWGLISGPLFRYYPQGFVFDVQGMSCFFENENQLYSEIVWQNSNVFFEASKIISPAGHIQIGEIGLMPSYQDVNMELLKIGCLNITISKQDWDAHETSWDFQENELLKLKNEGLGRIRNWVGNPDNVIHDYYDLSLLCNEYIVKWTDLFKQLHTNEEELNRKFIEIHGLQDELTPDIPLNEVTILQKGEISIEDNEIIWHNDEIIKQFLHYLVGCFMGRYSIDKPGLIIASQGERIEELDIPVHTLEIDDDAIIPIIQEPDFFSDDMTQRIEAALRILFGNDGYYQNKNFIEETIGMSIRDWFFKEFYDKHLEMYSVKGAKRPIYWMFSSKMGDKRKAGHFKAIVYMHRMEADTLSKLHADYVVPYVEKVQRQFAEAEEQASRDDLSPKKHRDAMKEVENQKVKLKEVKEFSEELAKMASRKLTIDLDDGVKKNYPKFAPLVEPIKGLESKED